MNKPTLIGLAVIVALSAIASPIVIAISQARKQGMESEMAHMLTYAHDVVRRSDTTTDQITSGVEKLEKIGGSNPCSDENIAVMRDVDVSSSNIQAIGYVAGNYMVCSSLGTHFEKINLGPVDLVTPRGGILRNNVKLPFAKDHSFIVLEYHHYAAIVHKDLPLDTATLEKDVSLATFSLVGNTILTSRGFVDPNWVGRLTDQHEVAFSQGGYVVAVVRSDKYNIGALAALPVSYLSQRTGKLAALLVPIGILSGLALAAAVYYLTRRQMSMTTAIKAALKRNEFFLAYQPVVDLKSGRCVGAEALIRWRTPKGELIRPDLFIPVAEQTGLIQSITERVIELFAKDAGSVFLHYPDCHFGINLSPVDFHSERILESLRKLVFITASKRNIVAEVTERGFLKADLAKGVLHKIRESGIRVAIDDFGTGYSSLSYLQSFELDYLKIDKSFVDSISTESPTSHVIYHIIAMAKALNLKMIAEGVETEAQAEFLREHGVQFAQGWLFGKPTSFAEIDRKLSSQG